MKKRSLSIAVAIVFLLVCAVGGTLAWFTDKTETVVNTFTVGNIDISLDEVQVNEYGKFLDKNGNIVENIEDANRITTGTNTYFMVPGYTYTKDPIVTVDDGSEDCYLFVKFEKLNNADTYLDYEPLFTADGSTWELVPGENDVWYIEVPKSAEDQKWNLLIDDTIGIKSTLTKENMDALEKLGTDKYPKLQFTAYAVQLYETNGVKFAPEEAWALANPPVTP